QVAAVQVERPDRHLVRTAAPAQNQRLVADPELCGGPGQRLYRLYEAEIDAAQAQTLEDRAVLYQFAIGRGLSKPVDPDQRAARGRTDRQHGAGWPCARQEAVEDCHVGRRASRSLGVT